MYQINILNLHNVTWQVYLNKKSILTRIKGLLWLLYGEYIVVEKSQTGDTDQGVPGGSVG